MTGKYKIGVVDNKPAYCYTEQVGRATIVALSPEVLQACLSAAKTRQSALNAGPLKESLERLPAETSKLVVVNVAGAMRSADSYLSWQYDNPKNPGHRLIGQLAQALDKTTVYLRTGEQLNSFNVHAGVEQIPPLGSVFPIAMQLSQTDLQAKARATEPEPSDGAVVTPGTEVKLSWKPGANAKSHKLYFATQADELSLVDEVTEPAYAKLPRPQRDKTYYWRVDEVQADGSVIEGDVWSFNTGKLVARWKFDETSGTTVADSAGSGYDGTAVHGKPVWDPDGKHGGCLDFDETYGFSIPKEVFSSIDKALTISVWVKGNEKQRRHSDVILQAGAGDDGKPYIVSIYTDWLEYGLKFATGFRQPDRLEFNPGAPEDWTGRWNHYAFVKDADRGFQRIYLN
ncbi:MAG: LamG domain-containing protein, partial [Planctomycetota bacterium]